MIRTDTEPDQEPVIGFALSERPQFYRVGDLGPFRENGRDLAGGKKTQENPQCVRYFSPLQPRRWLL